MRISSRNPTCRRAWPACFFLTHAKASRKPKVVDRRTLQVWSPPSMDKSNAPIHRLRPGGADESRGDGYRRVLPVVAVRGGMVTLYAYKQARLGAAQSGFGRARTLYPLDPGQRVGRALEALVGVLREQPFYDGLVAARLKG